MQEHIQRFAQRAITNKKITFILLLALIAAVAGIAAIKIPASDSLAAVGMRSVAGGALDIEIATVGATSTIDIGAVNNSWPGELVSLGSVPVQPSREGTIVSWNVYIGQRVYAGEVLGMLSQPPAMPDTLVMLADEEKMLAMARVNADAKGTYTKERIVQLEALRANTERSLQESQVILGSGGAGNSDFSMIAAKKEAIRSMLRGTFANTYPILSGNTSLPARWSSIALTPAIGALNSRLRNQFQDVVFAVQSDLDTPERSPVLSGLAYYDLAIKLADASIPDGALLTDSALMELKSMLHEDQEAFIMAVDKLRETELMAVDTEKMSFEQLRMIDSEIAMLKQDLAMAEGDVTAKEASYRAVRAATEGGSAIVAEKSGIVSSILKKPGDFVMPGVPVAVITGTKNSELFVRMRIPNNIKLPRIGETFSVVRTGFPQDVHKAKLIGIGNALSETGSVMADAALLEPTDWPAGTSLRVLVPESMDTTLIKLSALWFDAGGKPNVWVLSDAGRVYAKQLTLGRTIAFEIEVYDGLKRGDRYIVKPGAGITEDMLLSDVETDTAGQRVEEKTVIPNPHAGHAGMEGMEM